MKKIYILLVLSFTTKLTTAQSFCNNNGNVIIYSNYDGGDLKINVDQNIPNIKIGICSYEAVKVEVTGTYSANVTEILYAGYNNSPNQNCSPSISTTTFVVAPTTSTSILFAPNSNYSNTNGYSLLICNYSCNNTSSQGGCNTPDQLVDYFMTKFGGVFYYHQTQYGCYSSNTTYSVSSGGNCCIQPPVTTDLDDIEPFNTSISPNPAKDVLYIKNNSFIKYSISIYNQIGQKLLYLHDIEGHEKLNVSNLDKGIYFLLIEENGRSYYQKIVLE